MLYKNVYYPNWRKNWRKNANFVVENRAELLFSEFIRTLNTLRTLKTLETLGTLDALGTLKSVGSRTFRII